MWNSGGIPRGLVSFPKTDNFTIIYLHCIILWNKIMRTFSGQTLTNWGAEKMGLFVHDHENFGNLLGLQQRDEPQITIRFPGISLWCVTWGKTETNLKRPKIQKPKKQTRRGGFSKCWSPLHNSQKIAFVVKTGLLRWRVRFWARS